ncbi:MAG: hypothetical protein QM534_12750 [Sediminibacterium sp.]|nr:hypothetical protein [Sediminibacterium sp.]
MKTVLRFFAICLLSVSIATPAYSHSMRFSLKETPAKTICIKHPDANKPAFFSTVTVLHFEVYKPDTKADIVNIVDKLSKDPHVQSCNVGKQTGDYYAIHLILTKPADKAWFVSTFKSLGLNTIKLNNAEVTDVEKL